MVKIFAEDLKAIREEKNISLKSISQQTRINLSALENLENGDYSFQPQAYIRAFLKQYIACLDLDVEEVLFDYDLARSGKYKSNRPEKEIAEEHIHNHIGFVSPYLVLYEEFTTYENLKLFADIRGVKFNQERVDYLLNKFLIFKRKDDLLKTYSSGMKQRVKFIFALMHSPQLLILDEPTSNLDDEGKKSVYEIVKEEGQKNIVLIASNEKNDLELCSEIVLLEKFKN